MELILCLLAVAGAVALYLIPGPCVCKDCPLHVREREEKVKAQRALTHEVSHKGFGFGEDTPDRMNCSDKSCNRNRKEP